MSSALARFRPRVADYDLAALRADALSGVTVAVVTLPLALGFGVTSGAGAAAGLYTAMVAGFIAALFGGSNYQVSGPTGAMTVVLLPIVARHGPAALAVVGLLAGALLVVLAFARIGRFVNFIPYPVITGFTIGIAIIIFLQQVPGLLDVAKPEGEQVVVVSVQALAAFVSGPSIGAPVLGLLTMAVMLVWDRLGRLRGFPASMAALAAVTAVSLLPMFDEVARVGHIPAGLPTMQVPGLGGLALTDLVRAGV
ncbi:MAG TPA: SulP family inorganic anion transporter, partial [Euzebya sp.]|nr:SulP family inorganic anion transporter [Euzebya sp.]